MNYVAEIENGIVCRVVVSPSSIPAPAGWVVVGPENNVGIGWEYKDGKFEPPSDDE